ncbi:hypothetical protein SLE2022_145970 [Rubroshorea leprosula]
MLNLFTYGTMIRNSFWALNLSASLVSGLLSCHPTSRNFVVDAWVFHGSSPSLFGDESMKPTVGSPRDPTMAYVRTWTSHRDITYRRYRPPICWRLCKIPFSR